jgi:oligoendopeptidase F
MAQLHPYPINWDLSALLPQPQSPEFRQLVDTYKQDLTKLAARSAHLPPVNPAPDTALAWVQFLNDFERIDALGTDLRAHCECFLAADAENSAFQQLEAELASLHPLREQLGTNLDFALHGLSDSQLAAWTDSHPDLRKVRFFWEQRRLNAQLRLPKSEELLAAQLAVDGLHAWGRLYDRLSGALRVTVLEEGQPVSKSAGQVHFDSPERSVREANFKAVSQAWSSLSIPCAEAINHIAGTRLTIQQRLGLSDHLEVPLRYNRMTRQTLETMWSRIAAHAPKLAQYLDKKRQLLGLEQLAWFDLQAPLPGLPGTPTNDDDLPYDEACQQIVTAFQQFSFELGGFAEMALRQGWVEAEDRKGKRQGGFCTTYLGKGQSRIFMTYTRTADSMSTLAHELGHAYHSWVLRQQPYVLSDYPMNLAETASTFAEAVLAQRRLAAAESPYKKLKLLDGLLGDAVSFLMNIRCRFLFEDEFHRKRATGEVSATDLSAMMLAAQQTAYAGTLADDGYNPNFWISKLHFYITSVPFYNFPYTFGYLLSLGLYSLGEKDPVGFPDKYHDLLIATGCQTAEEAVQSSFGFDLQQPDFWENSLALIDQRVDEFLSLADEITSRLNQA